MSLKKQKDSIKLICLLMLFAFKVQALPEDKEKVMYLSADSADISQSEHRGVYSGNVQVDQGTTHLRATKVITDGDKNNKLAKAIAIGDKKNQAHYWSKTNANKPITHAKADKIYYLPKDNIIKLVGNACITQGKNTFRASSIVYDTLKEHVVANNKGDKKRTTIILYPEKKKA